ncbi:MAG: hypothetical protein JXX28_10540 [Deltaproteobacteria bacterium]|nr:hypothetical protein [Deltaproteobacteria bacterium]
MDAPLLTDWSSLLAASPLAVRGAVGLAGLLLLLAGARLYRPALGLTAFAFGALLAVGGLRALAPYLPGVDAPTLLLAGAVILGLVSAAVATFAHRVGLASAGAILGLGGGAAAWQAATGAPAPLWVPLGGAALGALALPFAFGSLLLVLTPAVGALCLTGAAGWGQTLPVMGGLWLGGTAIQWLTRKRKRA